MKNLFLLLIISATFFACNGSKTELQSDKAITTVSKIDDYYSNTIKEINEGIQKMIFQIR